MNDLIEKVQRWSTDRNLNNADSSKQLNKLMEELGELSAGYNKKDADKIIDSMGDMTVVMIILCQQLNLDFESCLQSAYDTIANRKGKTVDGVFIKDDDIQEAKQ